MITVMRRIHGFTALTVLLATACGGGSAAAPAVTVTVTTGATDPAATLAPTVAGPSPTAASTAIATAASGATYTLDCSRGQLDQADYMACVGAGHQPPQPTAGATSASGALVGTVDRAAHSVTWPDGRKITVLSIVRVPDSAYVAMGLPAQGSAMPTVSVRLRVEQVGAPTAWGAWGPSLLFGPNEADADGVVVVGAPWVTDTPQRLTQGNPVIVSVAYSPPATGLSTLAMSVPGGVEAPYESETIDGLASLLR